MLLKATLNVVGGQTNVNVLLVNSQYVTCCDVICGVDFAAWKDACTRSWTMQALMGRD